MNGQAAFLENEPKIPGTRTARSTFSESAVLQELTQYLPAQAPLKDFVHHNTLHGYQHQPFTQAIQRAAELFGYRVSFSLEEFRDLFAAKRISETVLDALLTDRKGVFEQPIWKGKLLTKVYPPLASPRIGRLREEWKHHYHLDLDALVHPILFRLLCSFLDQGIALSAFPYRHLDFFAAIQALERSSRVSLFRSDRARRLIQTDSCSITDLLALLVGQESLYKQYLFDQQFAHPGWSGMVAVIDAAPQTLLDPRRISLQELIRLELLLEIDALDAQFGTHWKSLSQLRIARPVDLFAPVAPSERREVLSLWQQAYEWSYYDQVLAGIGVTIQEPAGPAPKSFQALFCLDDRECSLRRYLETLDTGCQTFGTPGFFNVEFFFQPQGGRFYTKLCPPPVTPRYLIKELDASGHYQTSIHFRKATQTLLRGFLLTQTLGFWSAFRLLLTVFRPGVSPAMASSNRHMHQASHLTVENTSFVKEDGLQVGFTIDEMVQRVEGLLTGIGLVAEFAPIVYVIGHGASSVNNPYYAAYDCGACAGHPGSVNARVICQMANDPRVRDRLRAKGVAIPAETQFLGGLHDTTRDDISFYDEALLSPANTVRHQQHQALFERALDQNAQERSRRFESIDSRLSAATIHAKIRRRSVSLFEPRPELNHATNAVCLIGRRALSKNLFLDRRSFLNSYDYRLDPLGHYLTRIIQAAAPVCGGINLEYLFSRVDTQKLGAGSKLPHNVMGLLGVANGFDGDLRAGLPTQMTEAHDPLRLLMVIEQTPEVVLAAIQRSPQTYEWFANEWIHLVVIDPHTQAFSVFNAGRFNPYQPRQKTVEIISDLPGLMATDQENFPVYLLS
ncbi:YbcC family protein [Spirosoma flavum]|uniref:Probable inorganic carbon transporter subunit DabA n=1 Tax=Spirosoma flavum TaxID=2048557 RepID=A0ABW6AFY5_9BACT